MTIESAKTQQTRRLVVFGDDWDRHPSTIQHLMRGLLPRYSIDWINTVGTRVPRPTVADVRRGIEKLRSWVRPNQDDALSGSGRPQVYSPVHWPSFHRPWERRLNRSMLVHSLRQLLIGPPAPVAVVTNIAITADLAAAFPELNWVYFCGDDFPEWPDLDSTALRAMEVDMLPFMRAIVVVSEKLQERFQHMGYSSSLVTAGVDLNLWSTVYRKSPPPPNERPVATFWGVADPRLDVGVCEAIAKHCELVMIGPTARISPALLRNPSIHWRGPVPHSQLPLVANETDVLVMPYAIMPATLAMQPLKLKEYLATGLPVVGTPLPAAKPWADAMDIVADADEFAARVVERALTPLPASQRAARERLRDEAWDRKSVELERLLIQAHSSTQTSNPPIDPIRTNREI